MLLTICHINICFQVNIWKVKWSGYVNRQRMEIAGLYDKIRNYTAHQGTAELSTGHHTPNNTEDNTTHSTIHHNTRYRTPHHITSHHITSHHRTSLIPKSTSIGVVSNIGTTARKMESGFSTTLMSFKYKTCPSSLTPAPTIWWNYVIKKSNLYIKK